MAGCAWAAGTAEPDLDLAERCPNPNWTPEFQRSLDSFSYTLTGFTEPYIEITGP